MDNLIRLLIEAVEEKFVGQIVSVGKGELVGDVIGLFRHERLLR